ncbi:MAG: tripartite tricarboxylate transporter TctB family protein [Treponema sp.]|jgi:putative tricarboxylic transport membrane protein|nr:tripartite tricarboxylate transporter TctB family protein [Treponema sp.]
MAKYIKNGDILAGAVLFLIGMFMLINAAVFGRAINTGIGADFFPKIVSCALMTVSAGLLRSGIKAEKASAANNKTEPVKKGNYPVFAAVLVVFLSYVFIMPVLGFIITTIPFLFFLMLLLVPKKKRNIPLFLGVSSGVSLGTYLLFVKVFFVMLPMGLLG